MKLTLEIEMNNAAFEDFSAEVSKLVETVARKLANGADGGYTRDSNGNTVGEFEIEEDGGSE